MIKKVPSRNCVQNNSILASFTIKNGLTVWFEIHESISDGTHFRGPKRYFILTKLITESLHEQNR